MNTMSDFDAYDMGENPLWEEARNHAEEELDSIRDDSIEAGTYANALQEATEAQFCRLLGLDDEDDEGPHLWTFVVDDDDQVVDAHDHGPAGQLLIEDPQLGPCCICGQFSVGIIAMPFTAPVPGTGWGCFKCHLPMNGAYATLCFEHSNQMDGGILKPGEITQVCDGYAADGKRIAISDYAHEPFDHDLRYHEDEVRSN